MVGPLSVQSPSGQNGLRSKSSSFFFVDPPGRRANRRSMPTCPSEYSMQRYTQDVSAKSLSFTPPLAALGFPPQGHAWLDHPLLRRLPRADESQRMHFNPRSTSAKAASQRGSPAQHSAQGPQRVSPHIRMVGKAHGHFSPPKPRRAWVTSGRLPASRDAVVHR